MLESVIERKGNWTAYPNVAVSRDLVHGNMDTTPEHQARGTAVVGVLAAVLEKLVDANSKASTKSEVLMEGRHNTLHIYTAMLPAPARRPLLNTAALAL